MNKIEEEIKAINHSITYCKQQQQKTKNPHIQQKIQHYINGLEKELQIRLEETDQWTY